MFQFIKVLRIHLVNYCGYQDTTFDFTDPEGGVLSFATFFGPNGIGKTTGMRALQMAANPSMFRGRERDSHLTLRRSIHDQEYIPTVDNVKMAKKNDMLIDVDFLTDKGIKNVQIDNMGLLKNELGFDTPFNGYTYFCDADNPQSTQKFLLAFDQSHKFLTFAETVYGYECELGSPVSSGGITGYTDFIIKKGSVKVHFKSMSAGEKKIATLISDLCQPVNTIGRDIILIDNVEMHVYFTRHTRMIDKLREVFPDKQIITTTHSSVVIEHVDPKYHFDLENYRPDYRLLEITEEHRNKRVKENNDLESQGEFHKTATFSGFLQYGNYGQNLKPVDAVSTAAMPNIPMPEVASCCNLTSGTCASTNLIVTDPIFVPSGELKITFDDGKKEADGQVQ